MEEPAVLIPDLERLMRDVLRGVLADEVGAGWHERLGARASEGLRRAADLARQQRPAETLLDDWSAAGLPEIAAVLRSQWDKVGPSVSSIWAGVEYMSVDLERLRSYRGRELHQVAERPAPGSREEASGTITRLRTGFEALRRRRADEDGEWWPYIESVHSNISEFCVRRPNNSAPRVDLNDGDIVAFDIRAVHPWGPEDRLRYRVWLVGVAGVDSGWVEQARIDSAVQAGRALAFHVFVADAEDLSNSDEWVFPCRARPARPHT